MADKDKVVGKALYLEFRSTGQTYQVRDVRAIGDGTERRADLTRL